MDWGGVIVTVRWEGKSEGCGGLVGISWILEIASAGTWGRVSIELEGLIE